jgi:hypothetical protein
MCSFDPLLPPRIKVHLRWITGLIINPNMAEENTTENLCNFGFGKDFLNMPTKIQPIKEQSDKLDFIKVKTFAPQKIPLRD